MKRLLSLDVLRGLTVACMVFVNNGLDANFPMLIHSKWNGLSLSDLVFPFFLFMIGVSVYISMSRHAGEPGMTRKILLRTLLMIVIGIALHAWEMCVKGNFGDIPQTLRFTGVLQRLAIGYCAAALFFNAFHGKYLWHAIISLLVLYAILLIVCNGYSLESSENSIGKVDTTLFGRHIYRKVLDGRSPVDPEGLVGCISTIAHALIGVVCGRALLSTPKDEAPAADSTTEQKFRLFRLLLLGFTLGFIGYLISFGWPINKRLWSPSYVLVTCSMAAGMLALFTYLIDLKGHQRWCRLFQMFGLNALFIYVISEMYPCVLSSLGISQWLENFWLSAFSGVQMPLVASLFYALTHVALMSLLAYFLYKKKIFIKL